MGTAVTVTKIKMSDAAGGKFEGVFTLALDTSDANGNQTIDLTDYFANVYSVVLGGNDTLADSGYNWSFILPTYTTAISSTNVLLTARDEALAAVTSTDLSAVGDMRIIVTGEQAT